MGNDEGINLKEGCMEEKISFVRKAEDGIPWKNSRKNEIRKKFKLAK